VVAICLIVRMCVVINVADTPVVLDSWKQWIQVFLYFWLMENAPYLVRPRDQALAQDVVMLVRSPVGVTL
jgi:hypothetical protein